MVNVRLFGLFRTNHILLTVEPAIQDLYPSDEILVHYRACTERCGFCRCHGSDAQLGPYLDRIHGFAHSAIHASVLARFGLNL